MLFKVRSTRASNLSDDGYFGSSSIIMHHFFLIRSLSFLYLNDEMKNNMKNINDSTENSNRTKEAFRNDSIVMRRELAAMMLMPMLVEKRRIFFVKLLAFLHSMLSSISLVRMHDRSVRWSSGNLLMLIVNPGWKTKFMKNQFFLFVPLRHTIQRFARCTRAHVDLVQFSHNLPETLSLSIEKLIFLPDILRLRPRTCLTAFVLTYKLSKNDCMVNCVLKCLLHFGINIFLVN